MYKVNEMRMPTRSYLGLNHIEYRPSILWKKEFSQKGEKEKNNKVEEAFKNESYGLSEDILKENYEYRNFDIYREASGDNETEIINLKLTKDYNQLVSAVDLYCKEGSKSSYLINFSSEVSDQNLLINSLIRIKLEKNSQAKLVIVSNLEENSTNLQSISSIIDEDAKLDISYIELGADVSFVNIKNHLKGDRSILEENGVYFKEKDEFLDLLTVNEHTGEETDSRTMFNGALKDRAIKNRKGVVDLLRGAKKADGKIGDYSMMLSDDVINKSAPVLLNKEKEVSGNHAASVGRLNKDMLFYIMSRGFSKKQAESLMLEANFAPTLDKVEDENLREELKASVHKMNKRTD
jgi:Fe-S cluster assembly protein SufD